MGTNREIKSDGNVIIKNITWPSSDGTANQVLATNGSGVLSFATAASGGADVDTVASASDATNYTGTARFINITSSANVTFTNTSITDRIIYCSNNITVKFQPESFKNNIVKMSGASSTLTIENPHDGTESGNETNVHNCDIQCKNVLNLIGGVEDFSGDESPLDFHLTNCTVNATQISLSTTASAPQDQKIYIESSNINCAIFQSATALTGTSFVKFGSKVVAQYVIGFFDVDDGGSIECLDGSNSQTVRIDNGSGTCLNSAYNFPFTVKTDGIKTLVIAQGAKDSDQACNANTTITFGGTNTSYGYIDNTSSLDSNGKFTAKVKGMYQIKAALTVTGADGSFPSSIVTHAELAINGSVRQSMYPSEMQYTGTTVYFNFDCIAELDIGDYAEIKIAGNDTSYSVKGAGYSIFSVSKIN